MTQLAKVEKEAPQQLATVVDNVSPMFAMIERAARDPSVDIDKLERLMQMKVDADAKQARADFDAAMAEMQPQLPSIGERGNAAGRYTYALWEDINAAIKPVLMAHGFALTFRTDFSNGIKVTGVLSHRNGHREETSIALPADPSGNKNAVQAVASSVSYGKRYTAGALLNLTSHGEDDDAHASVARQARSASQKVATDEEIMAGHAALSEATNMKELSAAWASIPVHARNELAAFKDEQKAKLSKVSE
jgi:hypothetical protein